jgi:hypothetical protein
VNNTRQLRRKPWIIPPFNPEPAKWGMFVYYLGKTIMKEFPGSFHMGELINWVGFIELQNIFKSSDTGFNQHQLRSPIKIISL